MEPDAVLKVGGRSVAAADAREFAGRYLSGEKGWAYPSYDRYHQETATGPLTDGDFLAPMLLNVPRISIRTYEELQGRRCDLQGVLDRIPVDLGLDDATPDHLELIGEMFSVLDGAGVHGARATVLTKVLHRKRPGFIPLYDEHVRSVYQSGDDPPVAPVRGRSWRDFAVPFAAAVQADLRRHQDFWEQVAALATDPVITPLRALDIVAWWVGHRNPARLATAMMRN